MKLVQHVTCACGEWITIDRRCHHEECAPNYKEGQFTKVDHPNTFNNPDWIGTAVVFPFWSPISNAEIIKVMHG